MPDGTGTPDPSNTGGLDFAKLRKQKFSLQYFFITFVANIR